MTCINEGVYGGGLSFGLQYEIIEHDPQKRQFLVENDRGRRRWYPEYCFDTDSATTVRLEKWHLDDSLEHDIPSEVTLELSDGSRRWCIFATPDQLSRTGDWLDEDEGVRWHPPSHHLFILTELTPSLIEKALKEVERKGKLPEHSLPL
jgi:hypothetical protein